MNKTIVSFASALFFTAGLGLSPAITSADRVEIPGAEVGTLCEPLGDYCPAGLICINLSCQVQVELDTDLDGVPDGFHNWSPGAHGLRDNCKYWGNSDQRDSDFDGVGDACEKITGRGENVEAVATRNSPESTNTVIGAETWSRVLSDSFNWQRSGRGLANVTAFGFQALGQTTSGQHNTAVGSGAARETSADFNTAIGSEALWRNKGGQHNTVVGSGAARETSADFNTAIGSEALWKNKSGQHNTAVGSGAARQTNGVDNTAVGSQALTSHKEGEGNTAIGYASLNLSRKGSNNTAVGLWSLKELKRGNNNVAIGFYAGASITEGSGNIYIGSGAGCEKPCRENDKLYIANSSRETGLLISGDFASHNVRVHGDFHANGNLTQNSDGRLKKDIQPLTNMLESVLKVEGKTYRWKEGSSLSDDVDIGLVAQEVEKVFPELVVEDEQGYKGIAYSKLSVILLEAIKEQQGQIIFQQEQIRELEKQNEQINAMLHEQMDSLLARMAILESVAVAQH